MPANSTPWQDDFDTPWKGLLECFPEESVTLFYPELAAEFDWTISPTNLQQELDSFDFAKKQRGIVDALMQLRLKSGEPRTLLCHLELHNRSMGFEARSERMLDYWMPIFRKKREPIVSLLLFTHRSGPKQVSEPIPGEAKTLQKYSIRELGSGVDFYYHAEWIRNILDRCGEDFFETSTDPAAIFIHAHLKTLETQKQFEHRAEEKFKLFERVGQLGMGRDQAEKLFGLIGRLLKLPDELELQVDQKVIESFNKKENMEVTVDLPESSYQRALKHLGRIEILRTQLQSKFGLSPTESKALLDPLEFQSGLVDALAADLLDMETIEDFKKWFADKKAKA